MPILQFNQWVESHTLQIALYAAGLMILSVLIRLTLGKRRSESTTHGSARWATRREIMRACLFDQHGVVLGKAYGKVLRHNGPEHIMLCGPTRSRKGISTIIPTLFDWKESAIVLDPKDGENYDATAKHRRRFSFVLAFAPHRQAQTRFNVLDTIRIGTIQEVGDTTLIANSLTAPAKFESEDSSAAHFRDLASLLLRATILHVCYVGGKKSLSGVWEFLTQEHHDLSSALKVMMTTHHTKSGVHPIISSSARVIKNISGDRELSSVWTTTIRPLILYSDPSIAASTEVSDFSAEVLQYGKHPVTLYLIAPSPIALDQLHPVYRVILDVVMTRLMERKVRTWNWRMLNCLDELPWYGYCRSVDKGIAVRAGYGQKDLIVAQDLDSLLETYGPHTAIFGNCKVKIWHAPDNDLTAKRISENLLGRETIQTTTISRGGRLGRRTISEHHTGRLLLMPDEVMGLPEHQEIVQVGGVKILAKKIDYRTEKEYRDVA